LQYDVVMTARNFVSNLARIWAASHPVCGGSGIIAVSRRVRFMLRSLAEYGALRPLLDAPPQSPLARLLRDRPEAIGAVVWPYQCSGWKAATRLDRIRDHYAVVEELGGPIDFAVDGVLPLVDLPEIRDGLRVVLDQPMWFLREGQLAINLFLADTRIYSVVFSFFHHDGDIAAFVGAIQGRDVEGALGQYRELTKAAYGMRPRDLLIETFRMLCAILGVRHIFAVADQYRDYQSGYFGDPAAIKAYVNNYDDIWADRGGQRVDPMFYRLDANPQQRELSDIPAKKRGMYRQRYAMLDAIRLRMERHFRGLDREAALDIRRDNEQASSGPGQSAISATSNT
jgi:uncharacterized protein